MTTRAYSSNVTSAGHLVVALVLAGVFDALALTLARLTWPLWAGISVLMIIIGLHQGVVALTIGSGRMVIGRGPWRWPSRSVALADLVQAESVRLNWGQVFGVASTSG